MMFPSLDERIEDLKFALKTDDLVVRRFHIYWNQRQQWPAALLYIDGITDKRMIQDALIKPMLERIPAEDLKNISVISLLQTSIIDAGEVRRVRSEQECLDSLVTGNVIVWLDGEPEGLAVLLPEWRDRGVPETKNQTVVRGPQEAFTEALSTNLSLVRRRVKSPDLRIVRKTLGTVTNTNIAILYVSGIADDPMVATVLEKIDSVSLRGIFEGEYLEELIRDDPKSIFPTVFNTDRPDTVSAGLVEGRIAIIVDGSPFALIVPSLFMDFIHSAEDHYQLPLFSTLIRLLRLLALFIATMAPSLYVAITTFHQDLIPTKLLISLAAQREGVPFSALLEALMMEITFEILREAGIRMPRTIGQAVSIVGTIVIGQAAVEAGIVSAVMIIVVAITAISSFAIPGYSLSVAIRIIRFVLMLVASFFGLFGLTVCVLLLVTHLCSLSSLGKPYMGSYAPFSGKNQSDYILRLPYWMQKRKRWE